MSRPVFLEIDRDIGVISVDHPPVNALSWSVRAGLQSALRDALTIQQVRAIVLACAGRTFFVGADIAEFDRPIEHPSVPALVAEFDASPKPVVAAIQGTALGGGFELALGCHYRVAADGAKVGLPEVQLGILPGAGGTQRVPRIIGAARALDMLTSGRRVSMEEAESCGLVDVVVPVDRLREEAIAFARSIAASPPPRVRDRTDWLDRDRDNPDLFAAFLADHADSFRGRQAPWAIVEAIRAAVTLPFDQACAKEWELCQQLMASSEAAALRALFFSSRRR